MHYLTTRTATLLTELDSKFTSLTSDMYTDMQSEMQGEMYSISMYSISDVNGLHLLLLY